mmetsp:Transcript_26741/g.58991  ORF Transcript_26741/g.58991 Transcript_26741/m.58991 type:complete len:216 (-) Transcript_26741:1293-1940(-)
MSKSSASTAFTRFWLATISSQLTFPPVAPISSSCFFLASHAAFFSLCLAKVAAFSSLQPNCTTTAEILSSLPRLKACLTSALAASSACSHCFSVASTAFCGVRTSKTPSVPSTTDISFSFIWCTVTSGSATTSGEGVLKYISPIDRVIPNPWYSLLFLLELGLADAATRHVPLTWRINPPAFSTLLFSSGLSGLWSLVSGMASPPRHKMALESPT